MSRFSENVYSHNQYASTIGIDFTSRMIRVDRAVCKLEIWDTAGECYSFLVDLMFVFYSSLCSFLSSCLYSFRLHIAGQERFAVITANYYRGAQGALVVYDISERQSFEQAVSWFERARQLGGDSLVAVLVGNKNDLPDESRQVSTSEGEELAARLGISFIETSALNGTNVENAFVLMTSKIKASVDARGLTGVSKGSVSQASSVQLGSGEKKTSLFDSCSCGF